MTMSIFGSCFPFVLDDDHLVDDVSLVDIDVISPDEEFMSIFLLMCLLTS